MRRWRRRRRPEPVYRAVVEIYTPLTEDQRRALARRIWGAYQAWSDQTWGPEGHQGEPNTKAMVQT